MLPQELIEKIAWVSAQSWFTLVRTCKFLAVKAQNSDYKYELMDCFAKKTIDLHISRLYYKLPDGSYHRGSGLPAVMDIDGRKEWWRAGKLHRDGDLPAVASFHGNEWWENGRCIRTDSSVNHYMNYI